VRQGIADNYHRSFLKTLKRQGVSVEAESPQKGNDIKAYPVFARVHAEQFLKILC